MKITWFGHAMFLLEANSGIKIVTDPYSEKTGYKLPRLSADIVTVSHHHYDHDNASAIDGSPKIVESAGSTDIEGIRIEGISSYHDEVEGKKRGSNTIFKFHIDGLTVAHMGDYGQPEMTEGQLNSLKGVDVLLIPIGGTYTIDYNQASQVIQSVNPKVVIPMHFKTSDCVIKIDNEENFLQAIPVSKKKGHMVQLTLATLPGRTEAWLLEYR